MTALEKQVYVDRRFHEDENLSYDAISDRSDNSTDEICKDVNLNSEENE